MEREITNTVIDELGLPQTANQKLEGQRNHLHSALEDLVAAVNGPTNGATWQHSKAAAMAKAGRALKSCAAPIRTPIVPQTEKTEEN